MYYFFSFYKIIVDGLIRNLYIKSFKMYDMLISLQECCIDFISDYLQDLCIVSVIENISIKKFVFKDFDIFFYGGVFEGKFFNVCVFCGRGSVQILQMVIDEVNVVFLQVSWYVIYFERFYVQVFG